jgi:ribosomal protein S18 acetylase RimI-like enzyme
MKAWKERLGTGVRYPDRCGDEVLYRYLSPSDDIVAITELLHEAYAPLAASGMRYVASYQEPEVTKRRMAKGETIVATKDGNVDGLVTLASIDATQGSPFYDRPDVASFGQFAVRRSRQRLGIGSTLIRLIEARAAEQGVAELALDTSEDATHLIAFYESRGYRFVEYCQWSMTNYRSMVFAKRVGSAAGAL